VRTLLVPIESLHANPSRIITLTTTATQTLNKTLTTHFGLAMLHYQYQRGLSPSFSHFKGNDHRDRSARTLSISSPALRTTTGGTEDKDKEEVFPLKLYTLLESVHAMGFTTLPITWLPHGRAFIVNDTDAFVREVMPRFWTATKIRSFTRQLSLWGYKR
jgi:hypothetical protein